MRIFGLLVTRNECDRYLQSCLAWNLPFFDGMLVYDDGSTDDTMKVVEAAGKAHYTVRPDNVPTFLEHEGRLRQDAILALDELFMPKDGDWIFVIDADEFIVVDGGDPAVLRDAAAAAERSGCKSVQMRLPEMWEIDPPLERTDGFWGSIKCTRFYKWQPGGRPRDLPMGCGAEPSYVATSKIYIKARNIQLMHVGYAHPDDVTAKYARYSSLANNGHADSHIESITAKPDLKRWKGEMPAIWRGVRDI